MIPILPGFAVLDNLNGAASPPVDGLTTDDHSQALTNDDGTQVLTSD